MVDERDAINEATETFLESYLSDEARGNIAARYGEGVAARVKALYDDALNRPVDWRAATIDTALPVMYGVLDDRYPWLSHKARLRIIHAFVMAWK